MRVELQSPADERVASFPDHCDGPHLARYIVADRCKYKHPYSTDWLESNCYYFGYFDKLPYLRSAMGRSRSQMRLYRVRWNQAVVLAHNRTVEGQHFQLHDMLVPAKLLKCWRFGQQVARRRDVAD